MRMLRSFLSALVFAAAVACGGGGGGSTSTTPAPPTTGSLTLTVAGLPSGMNAAITITGPSSFNQSATGSGSWSNLTPGTYTVAAAPASTYLPSPATQTATVNAGQTAVVTVTYAAPLISVSVSPTNPKVGLSGTVQLNAVVSGTTNQAVTWSVDEGTAGGSVSTLGLYTAPAVAGVYHARATSVADISKYSTATVTVSALGGFRVVPSALNFAPGGTQQYQAWDDTTLVSGVTWSVPSTAGTITTGGLFTASATYGTYTLTATNTSTLQQATSQINIVSNVTFSIIGFPDSASLFSCDGAGLQSVLFPDSGIDRTVTWDVLEGAGGGSIADMGWYQIYLASATPATYHVRAVPAADPSKVALRAVQVAPNPGVGTFQATTNSPATTRIGHAAAALPDGRVVLTGGWGGNPGSYLTLVEVFTPSSNTFTTFSGVLARGRSTPVLAALDSNRVLVCGGEIAYDSASDTGEIINLGTGAVSAAGGAMRVRRMGHQVTALTTGPNAGKFLITGGMDVPNNYGTVSATADLFDPSTNTFSPLPQNMEVARANHTATRLNDGRILITGGFDGNSAQTSAEIFDPIAGTFSYTTGHLASSRYWHTATLLQDGRVLITGGSTGNPKSCELFDPATGNFTAGPDMQESRLLHTATLLNDGRVLVTGGNSGDYRYHGTAEVFTPASTTWAYSGVMRRPRQSHTAVLLPNGKVLVVGDLDNKATPAAETSN